MILNIHCQKNEKIFKNGPFDPLPHIPENILAKFSEFILVKTISSYVSTQGEIMHLA